MATLTAVHPGKLSDQVSFRPRYGIYIGGKWAAFTPPGAP